MTSPALAELRQLIDQTGDLAISQLPAILARMAALCDAAMKPPLPAAMLLLEPSLVARAHGYTGDSCTICGQFRMKQSGHCLVCDCCGSTTGCS